MAGIKISALGAVPSVAGSDLYPTVQGGTTYKATVTQLSTFLGFSSGLLALSKGGTNANLTAALGAVPYSTASAFALLAPGTAGQLFQSGGAGAPNWTTTTYPTTNAINTIMYASSANVLGSIAAVNSAVLVSDAGGVPIMSQTLPGAVQANISALGTQVQALDMGSHQINNVTDPTSPQDACTKSYADSIAAGITVQGAVVVGTTTALTVVYNNGVLGVGATLTNAGAQAAFSSDGVSPAINSRVLVKDQAAPAQNGIYTLTTVGSGASNWVLTRATDYDQVAEIQPGDLVVINTGTTLATTSWLQTATVVTVGTDAINFSQFSAAVPYTVPNGGTGITSATAYGVLTGGTMSTNPFQVVTPGSAGTIFQSGGAAALPAWSTATYPAVATGTGTFLRADGTNWVASTLTIPNTAVVNTIPYASSTDVWGAISPVNSAILASSAGGVPAWTTSPFLGTATATSINGTIIPTTTAGTAAWIKLSVATAANSASIEFTGLDVTKYTAFVVDFQGVYSATDNVAFSVVNGTGAGPTYNTANYIYSGWVTNTGSASVGVFNSTSAANIPFFGAAGNTTQDRLNGRLIVFTGKVSAVLQNFYVTVNGYDTTEVFNHIEITGMRDDATAITALKFAMSSGNITAGTFTLYGVV